MPFKRMSISVVLAVAVMVPLHLVESHAAARRADHPAAGTVPVDSWTWLNPMEGVNYRMEQFPDGTIVAIRQQSQVLPNGGKPYTINPGDTYGPTPPAGSADGPHTRGPGNMNTTQGATPIGREVYSLWRHRKIPCEVSRNSPDLFGIVFKVCQAAPFEYTPHGGTAAVSARGEVWIFIPPVTGKQEAPRRGAQPGWGR